MMEGNKFKEVAQVIEIEGIGSFHRVSRTEKPPMDFERLKFLCYFAAGMVAEVLGLGVILVFALGFFGVFK